MTENGTRRDQIVAAAFALTEEFSSWTLAEVAAKVGVSKPALYRHFRNKEEIEAVMESVFRERLLAAIEGSNGTQAGFRRSLRDFFRNNAGFLDYFMARVFAPGSFEEDMYAYLRANSAQVEEFHRTTEGLSRERRERINAGILKGIVSVILASVREEGLGPLQEELLATLERGLPNLGMPGDGRIAELDAGALLAPEELAVENRLFAAIAASVREYGFALTTTERIAEKMGLTKSSLYFYYPTKEAMFAELTKTEHEMLFALCAKRIREGKSLAEQLYSLMAVHANYLLMRPDVLPVFDWIRFETVRERHRKGPPEGGGEELIAAFRMGDLFPEDSPGSLRRFTGVVKWVAILAISAVLQGYRKGNSPDEIRNTVRLVYRSILLGDAAIEG